MTDTAVIYLEADDEVTSVIRRLRAAEPGPVIVVAPGRSRATSSVVALRLLGRVDGGEFGGHGGDRPDDRGGDDDEAAQRERGLDGHGAAVIQAGHQAGELDRASVMMPSMASTTPPLLITA